MSVCSHYKVWLSSIFFTRFAWALFPSISTFLQTSVSRLLLLRTKDGQSAKDVSGSQCQNFTKASSQASNERSHPSELEPIVESRVEGCESDSETPDDDVDRVDTVELRKYQQRRESWLQKERAQLVPVGSKPDDVFWTRRASDDSVLVLSSLAIRSPSKGVGRPKRALDDSTLTLGETATSSKRRLYLQAFAR